MTAEELIDNADDKLLFTERRPCTSWTVTRTRWQFLQSTISFSWQSDPGEEGTFSRKELCHADAI